MVTEDHEGRVAQASRAAVIDMLLSTLVDG